MLFDCIICCHENNHRPVKQRDKQWIIDDLIMLLVSQAWPVIDFVFLNIETRLITINNWNGFQQDVPRINWCK